ncbi:hypothetical protein DPEC_G00183790 [Dallia pectoralis]|uniref:Uncharacterized protein n=1 Tax=Dallia pectoralis TaxID=75939 RepID=A0ACC2GB58_DALPE|nr:hypothetical protein DPEC_G00183790 [Dallia pectoralis]
MHRGGGGAGRGARQTPKMASAAQMIEGGGRDGGFGGNRACGGYVGVAKETGDERQGEANGTDFLPRYKVLTVLLIPEGFFLAYRPGTGKTTFTFLEGMNIGTHANELFRRTHIDAEKVGCECVSESFPDEGDKVEVISGALIQYDSQGGAWYTFKKQHSVNGAFCGFGMNGRVSVYQVTAAHDIRIH